jgi:lipoate-protein ligase A
MDGQQFPPYPGDLVHLHRYRSERQPFFTVETVRSAAVVLGCGTPPEPDLALAACRADGVPVYRRKGGGGAVVLAPGVVVLAGCFPPVAGRFPDAWSQRLVELVREALTEAVGLVSGSLGPPAGPPAFHARGLGDLCVQAPGSPFEQKVLGSSLYLARDVVLYQASLLCQADLALLPRYLGPPSREPRYRAGRSHLEFVANLPAEWRLDWAALSDSLKARLPGLCRG